MVWEKVRTRTPTHTHTHHFISSTQKRAARTITTTDCNPASERGGVWGQREGGGGKGCRSNDPCARPGAASGMVALGGRWSLLLLCACVGWGGRGCVYLCAPVFPCVGVGLWGGDQELLVQLAQEGRKGYFFGFCGAVVLRCVLCLEGGRDPGPRWGSSMVWRGRWRWRWGSALLHGWVWRGRGPWTDDEGRTQRRASPRQEW